MDALIVKIRDGTHVRNKAADIAVGVDIGGIKHVLGIWVQQSEGAKFWAGVCAELANRGVKDVLIVCCDGLTGFPEAIESTWPLTTVQTCVVHLLRALMRFMSYKDRKQIAAALKPIYTAVNADAAWDGLTLFAASPLGVKYPATVKTFEDAWERFTPFLAFPPELRRVITQMYFPSDPLFPLDLMYNSIIDQGARDRLLANYDHELTSPEWSLGYRRDIVLTGPQSTWFEPEGGDA